MVGSVLMDRMAGEAADTIEPFVLLDLQRRRQGPGAGRNETTLPDAFNIDALQALRDHHHRPGGDYTNEVHPNCARAGWNTLDRRRILPCAWKRTPSSCSTR